MMGGSQRRGKGGFLAETHVGPAEHHRLHRHGLRDALRCVLEHFTTGEEIPMEKQSKTEERGEKSEEDQSSQW